MGFSTLMINTLTENRSGGSGKEKSSQRLVPSKNTPKNVKYTIGIDTTWRKVSKAYGPYMFQRVFHRRRAQKGKTRGEEHEEKKEEEKDVRDEWTTTRSRRRYTDGEPEAPVNDWNDEVWHDDTDGDVDDAEWEAQIEAMAAGRHRSQSYVSGDEATRCRAAPELVMANKNFPPTRTGTGDGIRTISHEKYPIPKFHPMLSSIPSQRDLLSPSASSQQRKNFSDGVDSPNREDLLAEVGKGILQRTFS